MGCGISIHAAHHQTEFEICRTKFDATPISHLANTGILGPDAVVTHVTFTDDHDRQLLADSHSTVVHCSYRKAREAVIGPFSEYLQRGINVALGTDSYSSDITETIRMAAVLGKIKLERVGAPTAAEALDAATIGGARGLGRTDLVRSTRRQGRSRADRFDQAAQFSGHRSDQELCLLLLRRDVETVMVDGKIVVDHGRATKTNEDELRERVRSATQRIWRLADEQGAVDGLRPALRSDPA